MTTETTARPYPPVDAVVVPAVVVVGAVVVSVVEVVGALVVASLVVAEVVLRAVVVGTDVLVRVSGTLGCEDDVCTRLVCSGPVAGPLPQFGLVARTPAATPAAPG